jgi:hypothetical protein
MFKNGELLGGAITCVNHLEKHLSQWVSDDIHYMKWKINMFETTNQLKYKGPC